VPVNKWLHFGGDPDHRLDTGIVFRICHYWEIRSGINRVPTALCEAAVRRHINYNVITPPAHDTQPRKTWLGGGIHCPSASSSWVVCRIFHNLTRHGSSKSRFALLC